MTTRAERGEGPPPPTIPASVGEVQFRPASRADLAPIHRVVLAEYAVDAPESRPSQDDVDNVFWTSGLDPATDALVAYDASGQVIAYGLVMLHPVQESLARVWLVGAVDPEYRSRGIGRRILAWQLDRSRQKLAGIDADVPAHVELNGRRGSSKLALAARFGMEPTRFWFELERDLADPVLVPPVPEGYVVREYAAADLEPTRLAKNDSFRDHWGSQPSTADDWARARDAAAFRPDLSRVVVDAAGEVVAFTLVDVDPESFEARGRRFGYIDYVGVVRAHRGRRLAPAVLGSALAAIRSAGMAAAVLDVDADSPTGALGLYERLGFTRGPVDATVVLRY